MTVETAHALAAALQELRSELPFATSYKPTGY
jgi:hypothetical protein